MDDSEISPLPSSLLFPLFSFISHLKAPLTDIEETSPSNPSIFYDLFLSVPLTSLITVEAKQHSSAKVNAVQTEKPSETNF